MPRFAACAAFVFASASCAFAQTAPLKSPKPPTTPAPKWEKIPLLSPDAHKAGVFPGGEGGQVIRELQGSLSLPAFLMMGTDVGGIFRSLDGGKNWQACNIGWSARGANAFAIDPKNPDRILGVGGNGGDWDKNWGGNYPNGLYVSTNRAARWEHLLPRTEGTGGAVAWEAASYDKTLGGCRVAYFAPRDGGLWKSSDGAKTWVEINKEVKAAFVCPHPQKAGIVFLGGPNGVQKSNDGGKTFSTIYKDAVFGLDVSPAQPDALWASGQNGVVVSPDGGKGAFAPLGKASGLVQKGKPVLNVRVSPLDAQMLGCWVQGDNWQWVRYTSRDGGETWTPITFSNALAPLPYNVRGGPMVFHSANKNIVWGLGGDWVTQSVDSGKTFAWKNNGNNGIMTGGMFNLNPRYPDMAFVAFQDYNGAFTTNRGKTWNYRDVSGKGWGGFCYGGYAASPNIMWCGDAPSWGGPRTLRLSRDGGTTWINPLGADKKPLQFSGPDVSYSDPADEKVLFAFNFRSADNGATWNAMPLCDAVFTASENGGVLWGKHGNDVVKSENHGASWETTATTDGGIGDLALSEADGKTLLYVASQDKLKCWDGAKWTQISTPPDQFNNTRIRTVACDPLHPGVVYAGGSSDIYLTNSTICRSTDGGKTWRNLTVTRPLSQTVADGPHEVGCVRVHPQTGEAWAAGQCFGLWKIAPPVPGETGDFISVWK